MKFPGAPYGLKMACGENPKRVYGTRMQAPMTRMGNMAGYRTAFIEAQDYIQQWDDYAKAAAKAGKDKKAEPAKAPKRDLRLETLAGVLKGEILVHIHRSEEHTSELQSLMRISYAVFCLKKKKTQHAHI